MHQLLLYKKKRSLKTANAVQKSLRPLYVRPGEAIVKNKYEFDNIKYYVSIIRKLQRELRLNVISFHDIGLPHNNDDINNTATTQDVDKPIERRIL
jgi:hypothetical protein